FIYTHLCLALYSSLPIPTPLTTLFPYTTLFRSRSCRSRRPQHDRIANNGAEHCSIQLDMRATPPEIAGGAQARSALMSLNGSSLDRKSTRLNSSHQIISYAVFCLKKKKNNQLQK